MVIFPYQQYGCLELRKLRVFNISDSLKVYFVESNMKHQYYINHSNRTYIKSHLHKNYLECVETERDDSKFTIGKCHINTIEIIKLFQVNIFMSVTKFPHLTIWLFCRRRLVQIIGWFRGLFKETNNKNQGFCIEKERGRKNTNS